MNTKYVDYLFMHHIVIYAVAFSSHSGLEKSILPREEHIMLLMPQSGIFKTPGLITSHEITFPNYAMRAILVRLDLRPESRRIRVI